MNELHDGKPETVAFIRGFHPLQRIYLADLEPGNPRPWPRGWTYTNNPQHLNTVSRDLSRGVLFSPTSAHGLPLTVYESDNGVYVLGQELAWTMMLLVEQGPPLNRRDPMVLWEYTLGQFEQCPWFPVAEGDPKTREQNEIHVASCSTCSPVSEAMAKAIDAGANISGDAHLADMIERAHAHENPAEAIQHYNHKAAAHSMAAIPATKPRRKAVAEQVTT